MSVKRVNVVFKIIRKETQSKTENNIKPECSHLESLKQSSAVASGKNNLEETPLCHENNRILPNQERDCRK